MVRDMRVDIWSDIVCPWCYVGKARFEKALDSFAHRDEVEVVFHSFELDPSSPGGRGESNLTMLSKKFGKSPAEALAMDDHVGKLARAEGLGFDSERPAGNTFDVHRVIHLGLDRGVQQPLLGAVNGLVPVEGASEASPPADNPAPSDPAAGSAPAATDPATSPAPFEAKPKTSESAPIIDP